MAKKPPVSIRSLRKELKRKQVEIDTLRELRDGDFKHFNAKEAALKAALEDKSDKLIPQKQELLKQLAFLTNSTSRAIRTTMWAIAPSERRGFGR
jgi:hypothetical protein